MISGFARGDTIALRSVNFDSAGSVQLLSGNVLQIVENGTTFHLDLDPGRNFSGDVFRLLADSAGGTDIIVGPGVGSGGTLSVSAGQTSNGLAVLSGGTLNVLSGGTTIATFDAGTVNVSSGGVDSSALITSSGGETVLANGIVRGATVSGGTITVSAVGRPAVPGSRASLSSDPTRYSRCSAPRATRSPTRSAWSSFRLAASPSARG